VSFDLQPTLKGDLVELRPLRPEDFRDLYAVASDPLIWQQHPVQGRYKEDVFKGFFRGALESRGALIAIDCSDGQVIGASRFHGYDTDRSEVEIGWTFLASIPLGRPLQQGNETTHAAARIQVRDQRCLSCRSTECSLAAGD
jgi:N-acetyltransferase